MRPTLTTRRLGTTDMEITTVGFGAWAIGGGDWAFGWGPQDDEQSIATIRHAVGRGINWIDTAAVYGLGHSEEVVRRALEDIPANDRPYVFTKCGQVWDEQDRMAAPRQVLRPESIRRECDASLRRLGVERIDLYQFHWPDETGTAVEDSWAAMMQLVDQGKVRAAGVSNFDVALLQRCEALRHVDSLQPPFSLIRRRVAAAEIPWCAAHGTGVIGYSPMQSGLLTERFSEARVQSLDAGDWRRRSPEFNPPKLGRNLALRDGLQGLARRHGTSVAGIAIAWTLAWSGVTGAIVGARTPEQVDGWLDSGSIELSDDDLGEIEGLIERTGAGAGPTRPR
ncbi:MAG TPA: aldo/keto reductase [Gemmatimonadales bacterium]|jgi:aryl-alcohol dehydrogenase-like predicted oxidoreductase|nr:aldo/keto reductase [Gemmatimonadales bacterium]